VHFPSSPSLTATFSTHSPSSYDRGAISVSPNPLELPAWGSRIFSPRSGSFGNEPSPGSSEVDELTPTFKTFTPPILSLLSPGVEVFPDSPVVDTKPTTRAAARFQAITSEATIRPVSSIGDALKVFPRSPYPSAPVVEPASPAPAVLADKENVSAVNEGIGKLRSRNKTISGYMPSRVSRLAAGKAKKVPPAITVISRAAEMRVSSPLKCEFSTAVEDSQQTATVANTRGNGDASLAQAFWQSMSLDDSVDMISPCITTEDPVASGLLSPGGMISPMIFATKEGVVWTPPRKDALFRKDLLDLRKPERSRAMVLSPAPEDPFSAFPSFAAVLSLDHGKEDPIIAYPPPAVTMESALERR